MEDQDDLWRVYLEDLKPLMVYWDNFTQYVRGVHGLGMFFKSLGD